MRACGRSHDRPERFEIFFEIEDGRKNYKEEKIGHVGKLHGISEHRICELRQPRARMHSSQIEIELNQPAIEPAGKEDMYETSQFFEEENIKWQRIPVARKTKYRFARMCGGTHQQEDAHGDR